jgi:hypothetical protein
MLGDFTREEIDGKNWRESSLSMTKQGKRTTVPDFQLPNYKESSTLCSACEE